jgi:hypothetical protein
VPKHILSTEGEQQIATPSYMFPGIAFDNAGNRVFFSIPTRPAGFELLSFIPNVHKRKSLRKFSGLGSIPRCLVYLSSNRLLIGRNCQWNNYDHNIFKPPHLIIFDLLVPGGNPIEIATFASELCFESIVVSERQQLAFVCFFADLRSGITTVTLDGWV